jgi:protein-S-isoprenylcysteine O-methyltransferase Ste14
MRDKHYVVSDGIYRRIRHPGHLGDTLIFTGSGVATGNSITTAVIFALLIPTFLRRIAVEERMLVDQLGEEYSAYMKKTRKLVPFVL